MHAKAQNLRISPVAWADDANEEWGGCNRATDSVLQVAVVDAVDIGG